jgi:hypothetical protein
VDWFVWLRIGVSGGPVERCRVPTDCINVGEILVWLSLL